MLHFTSNRLHTALMSGIVAVVTIFALSLIACRKHEETTGKKVSGTITATAAGTVSFMYSCTNKSLPDSCVFVTDLPVPNDTFTLHIPSAQPTATKTFTDLPANQKIAWKTTVEGNPINIGSEVNPDDHFVHIVNE
jgi:hypothetical protein